MDAFLLIEFIFPNRLCLWGLICMHCPHAALYSRQWTYVHGIWRCGLSVSIHPSIIHLPCHREGCWSLSHEMTYSTPCFLDFFKFHPNRVFRSGNSTRETLVQSCGFCAGGSDLYLLKCKLKCDVQKLIDIDWTKRGKQCIFLYLVKSKNMHNPCKCLMKVIFI